MEYIILKFQDHFQTASSYAVLIICTHGHTHERTTTFQRRRRNSGEIERLGSRSDAPELIPSQKERMLTASSDGGGVRGYSSLLILEALLEKVKEYAHLEQAHVLKPHEVFQLVVGTSTGGYEHITNMRQTRNRLLTAIRLSALMIGKLGMSVQDYIAEYPAISENIFKHGRHRRGKLSIGILLPRYCGKHFNKTVEQLFHSKNRDSSLQMSATTGDFTRW